MKIKAFLHTLEDRVILFDGAMGTMLYNKGIYINRCYDELNLSNPKIILEIHQQYMEAGVDCIETNTFGANRFKLEAHGFLGELEAINSQGAKLARQAAGDAIWVAGAIGPLGVSIEPWGRYSTTDAQDAFTQQAKALLEGGVDLFMLETFSDLNEIHQAILAIRALCDLPIIASMTIGDDGNSLYGTSPDTFCHRLDQWGVDALGINCSVGPQMMLETLEKMAPITTRPLSVMPNAGMPRNVENRNFYMASSEYMAEYTRRFIQTGAKIVGGCCGTTPSYIKAMRNAIRSLQPGRPLLQVKIPDDVRQGVSPIPLAEKSQLGKKLARKEFVYALEIVPPRGCDPSRMLEQARTIKTSGIDTINIPDGPRALARMSAQHVATLLAHDVGMETVLHYSCRDRNLLGMMSDMLGLNATGVRNLLLVTGDPPKMGTYPDATAVFDVDSIGLTNLVNGLNHGVDLEGNAIGKPTAYVIGVGVNPGAIDVELEIRRLQLKVNAGAEFAITQPIFDIVILENFLSRVAHIPIPIIAGIWPLVSLRNAEFLNNEVPGATIPEPIMTRIRNAEAAGNAVQEGLLIASEIGHRLKDKVQGFQFAAPLGKVQLALELFALLQ